MGGSGSGGGRKKSRQGESLSESTAKRPGAASGQGGKTTRDECDINFMTPLFGLVPATATTVRAGEVLDVSLNTVAGRPVIAVNKQGTANQVGTIVGAPEIPALIRCLQQGVAFVATVASVSGASIRVVVSRAP